jgi:hypothetical protein
MTIQFNNYRELLANNNLNALTYEERFQFYCNAFPEMKTLEGLRDCELVQLFDCLKRGFDLQECIDALANDWLREEYNSQNDGYEDLSTELKCFLWYADDAVWYAAN